MKNLETQLNKETLHEKDSKSTIRMINTRFQKFIHLEVLKTSNFEYEAREAREDFKNYTHMEAHSLKEILIQNMDSVEKCIVERALHEQEIQKRLKRLNDRKLQIQECKVQEVKTTNASSKDTNSTQRIKAAHLEMKAIETKHTAQHENMNDTSLMEKINSNTIPDSSIMCKNEFQVDQYADDHEDERATLANLISNLKLDIDENKTIQKQLRKANATLTYELKECKYTFEVSNDTKDRCISALHHQEVELEKYKTYKNCQLEKEEVEHKYKETLGLLAQQKHQSNEASKTQAYETF
ncbi:hypothetical protein Tco_0628744 [Tanacetum coccineum]|uniref:Uncharacterized protein n=1 Tax=Tanacetum coccineum TaxID=301880 RepID=A0ABQ4WR47_9ASTR